MSNSEFIQEIEEDLQRERLVALWKEYGPTIITGIILAVLFTGALSGWRSWNTKVNTAQTKTLIEALKADNAGEALEAASADLRPTQRALAWLAAAGAALAADQPAKALAIYDRAATDKKLPALYRDLAIVQGTRLRWDLETDKADPHALLAILRPIIDDRENPWSAHAAIQGALIAAHGLSDYAQAHNFLAVVQRGDNIPPSLKERARALDQVYAAESGSATPGAAAPVTEDNTQ